MLYLDFILKHTFPLVKQETLGTWLMLTAMIEQ